MFEDMSKKVDDAMSRAVTEAKAAGTWTQTKTKGREHGAAVRGALGFAGSLVVALAKDIGINASRVVAYPAGVVQGIVRPNA